MRIPTGDVGTVQLFSFYNSLDDPTANTDQLTVGGRWAGEPGGNQLRFEGSAQLGERGGQDVVAFMIGVRAGRKFGRTGLTLWYDLLSGDDDPGDGELKVFDTLFGTNHKFYGLMDKFLNIPVQTGGRGLHDIAVKLNHTVSPELRVNAALHSFQAARGQGLSGSNLGTELDLAGAWAYAPGTTISGGLGLFEPGDGFTGIGRPADTEVWVYLMLNVVM